MSTVESTADNGVNVQALLDARNALTDAPEAAEFTWRATNEWLRGTHSKTTIEQFSGLGADHDHKSTFSYTADHPEVFASEDNGADARSSSCSWAWRAASPRASPPWRRTAASSSTRSRPRSRAT